MLASAAAALVCLHGGHGRQTRETERESHTQDAREREREIQRRRRKTKGTHTDARAHTHKHTKIMANLELIASFSLSRSCTSCQDTCVRERERERERKRARERARAKAKDTAHTPKTHDVKPNACSHARTTCLTAKAMFAETEEAARKDGGVCIWGGLKWARDDTERRAPSCFTILFAKLSWRADAPRCCSSESACVAQRPSGT
jgi:hypothetical protein